MLQTAIYIGWGSRGKKGGGEYENVQYKTIEAEIKEKG